MPTRALALAALVAFSAGCVDEGGRPAFLPPPGGSGCPDGSEQVPEGAASWREPGLYAAALATGDWTRAELNIPPLAGMPFEDANLTQRWGPGYELVSIRWEGGDGLPWVTLREARPGEYRIETPVWSDADVLAGLDAVLGAIGLADHPEKAAWQRALLATRGEGPYLYAFILATPEVGELWSPGVGAWQLPEVGSEGPRLAVNGPWQLRFDIPTLELVRGNVTLRVDAEDRAQARATLPVGTVVVETSDGRPRPPDPPAGALMDAVNATLADEGLPAPTWADATGFVYDRCPSWQP